MPLKWRTHQNSTVSLPVPVVCCMYSLTKKTLPTSKSYLAIKKYISNKAASSSDVKESYPPVAGKCGTENDILQKLISQSWFSLRGRMVLKMPQISEDLLLQPGMNLLLLAMLRFLQKLRLCNFLLLTADGRGHTERP